MPYRLHPPRFIALSQFNLYILTFEKQSYGLLAPKPLCISKELRQRSAGPRRNNVENLRRRVLDSPLPNLDRQVQARRYGFQKPAFLCGRFIGTTRKSGLSRKISAITRPGKPAPLPRSTSEPAEAGT